MSKILYFPLWCSLVFGCISEPTGDPATDPKSPPSSTALGIHIDYQNLLFDERQALPQFAALFDRQKTIRLDNILLKNDQDSIYGFRQNWGDVTITREAANRYAILEHYIIPIGNVYGKVALVRYWFNTTKMTLRQDVDFVPQLSVYNYWSNHAVKAYDDYRSNPDFTNPDVAAIPYEAREEMRYLMFNLTLAAILENCAPCRQRMDQIHEDYPFVADQPYYDQNLSVCRTILRRFPTPKNSSSAD